MAFTPRFRILLTVTILGVASGGAMLLPTIAAQAAPPAPTPGEHPHPGRHPHLTEVPGAKGGTHEALHAHPHPVEELAVVIAVLLPTQNNKAHGVIRFTAEGDGVRLTGQVHELNPDSEHGFHVHEFGDISTPDGSGCGGHFNPGGHDHALPEPGETGHAGDFGNLKADSRGVAEVDMKVENVTFTKGPNAIVGRGLIVHANRDDGSQPVGNAGPRIAQAVIGIAAPRVDEAR